MSRIARVPVEVAKGVDIQIAAVRSMVGLIPLFAALIAITFIPEITLWLPRFVRAASWLLPVPEGLSLAEAAALLREATYLPFQFNGFTEGDKLARGDVDVVVCDGFVGNIMLKTVEATSCLIDFNIDRLFNVSLRHGGPCIY